MSFEAAAKGMLETLFNQVDDLYGDDADIDEEGDSLSIAFDNGQTWLINIQSHHEEIWLSSPLTGAHHYRLQDNKWLNTRNDTQLLETLLAELSLV